MAIKQSISSELKYSINVTSPPRRPAQCSCIPVVASDKLEDSRESTPVAKVKFKVIYFPSPG